MEHGNKLWYLMIYFGKPAAYVNGFLCVAPDPETARKSCIKMLTAAINHRRELAKSTSSCGLDDYTHKIERLLEFRRSLSKPWRKPHDSHTTNRSVLRIREISGVISTGYWLSVVPDDSYTYFCNLPCDWEQDPKGYYCSRLKA